MRIMKGDTSWTSCYSLNILTMAAPRSLVVDVGRLRDVENAKEDSPTSKKPIGAKLERFPLSHWELAAAASVFLLFSTGLFCVYLTMPAADYGKIKLPRSIADLRILKDNIATYAHEYQAQFILGYCSTYIFMQTFMIPGTIFMSLLAGALFGVARGLVLVVFNATAGASSCYFLSKLFGRPLVTWMWPERLRFFQAEAGLALGDLKSVRDLYDFKTLAVLFLIGTVSILPTILKRKRTYE
uniref:SNARE associated Golgi protein family n=1 Tax=Nelumbo nucifera TaxID=4432 RepID=A0A822Z3U6_NELNU|nr:TPA_asm: hypothetical protein HUJ06_013526 [Nelumbo nucifera]